MNTPQNPEGGTRMSGRPAVRRPGVKEREHRINEDIRCEMVRLVGEPEDSLNGVVPLQVALARAAERNLDLVEIAANANPPVCRIVEYSKYRYELKKKEKESKSRHHASVLKEIRFGPNTDDHDFNFKLRHAKAFLSEGHKIKAYVVFHGRSIVHKSRGEELLMQFARALENESKIEVAPKLEGKRMFMILVPKK
ncbi:MAG: translation initiation factor IF-3 [Bacteroidia bacterium]|nr:translation initiation factor IF-3 [Bacteroidia bacterium]